MNIVLLYFCLIESFVRYGFVKEFNVIFYLFFLWKFFLSYCFGILVN